MAKSNAQLTAEIEKLTKAHEVMVKEAEEQKESDAKTIAGLKAKNEELKAATAKRRQEQAEKDKKNVKARLDAEEHQWVQVFYKGLKDGVDFNFNYEGVQFVLYSGEPVELPVSVIKHLKTRGYPIITEKQGETGLPVKVQGYHHNFNVVNCEAPAKKAM